MPKGTGHKSEVSPQFSPAEYSAQISRRVIPALLRPLRIRPVLLHGGLWVRRLARVTSSYRCRYRAGATGTDSTTGEPVVFDASCVDGHNKAEQGMPGSGFEAYSTMIICQSQNRWSNTNYALIPHRDDIQKAHNRRSNAASRKEQTISAEFCACGASCFSTPASRLPA